MLARTVTLWAFAAAAWLVGGSALWADERVAHVDPPQPAPVRACCGGGAAAAPIALAPDDGADKKGAKPAPKDCAGASYLAEKCACPAKGCKGCGCGPCTRDAKCACIKAHSKGTGILTGKVKHYTVKKYKTLVYLSKMKGKTFKPPAKALRLDQIGKKFKPHILPVLVGTSVDFTNGDDFEHNVFSPDGEKYNLGNFGKGKTRRHAFKKPGVYVQLCKLHPEMVGFVIVTETPYWARVAKDGTFRIPNVPAGTWKLKVWNERLKRKYLKKSHEVTVAVGKTAKISFKP